MATRGIYGLRKNRIDKLTYNHFDSYPDCLGKNVIDFCRKTSIKDLVTIFDNIILVSETAVPTLQQINKCLFTNNKTQLDLIEFYMLNKKNRSKIESNHYSVKNWYNLLRPLQGNLDVYKFGLRYMIDNNDFIKNSLFCEYGYIINLDTNKLEFWRGFQNISQRGNRYGETTIDNRYPCILLLEFDLANIPADATKIMNNIKIAS